jgi:hypothetical protein
MRKDRRTEDGPNIQPGQIWLIEQSAPTALCALDDHALADADVVLYDRVFARLLTLLLPLGGYAEPLLAEADDGHPAISSRALKLAADGWSVVQLIEPSRRWRQRLRRAADELGPLNGDGSLTIQAVAKTTAAPGRRREAPVTDLPELVDALSEDELLTLIVGPLAGSTPAATCAFVGNGLAG